MYTSQWVYNNGGFKGGLCNPVTNFIALYCFILDSTFLKEIINGHFQDNKERVREWGVYFEIFIRILFNFI